MGDLEKFQKILQAPQKDQSRKIQYNAHCLSATTDVVYVVCEFYYLQ
jgi:hypothetical protein